MAGETEAKKAGKASRWRAVAVLAFVLCCVLAACVCVLLLVRSLSAEFDQFRALAAAPVVQLLAAALGQAAAPLAPFLPPLLCLLACCFFLSAAKKVSTERRRFGSLKPGAACLVILDAFQGFCLSFLKLAPVLAILLVTALGLNTLFVSVNRVNRIADNLRRVKELGIMVRNLSRSDDLARITLLDRKPGVAAGDLEKTYRVDILSEDGDVVSSQKLTLAGNRIAIDSVTVNFEYSEIESGRRQNIAYPYRVYSELMKPDEAVPLTCMFNGEGLPVIYCLEESSIYGMTKDSFFARLKELFEVLKDEEQCRQLGIRSANGTVNHFVMNPGDVYTIRVEATGGLTVHKKLSLD